MAELPIGKLRLEQYMTLPPKPVCFHVVVDGKTIALLSLDEVQKAADKLKQKEK